MAVETVKAEIAKAEAAKADPAKPEIPVDPGQRVYEALILIEPTIAAKEWDKAEDRSLGWHRGQYTTKLTKLIRNYWRRPGAWARRLIAGIVRLAGKRRSRVCGRGRVALCRR